MESEIFSAFLILGTLSTMVCRRIFDKRANYVGRFVKISGYSEFFKVENVPSHQFVSISLQWRVKYIWAFLNPWNNVYNGVEADF